MKSQAIALAALTLTLAACAAEPPPPGTASTKAETAAKAEPDNRAAVKDWMGLWTVAEQFGATQPTPAAPPMGQILHLESFGATDMAGRTCSHPDYRAGQETEAGFLSLGKTEDKGQDDGPLQQVRPTLTVTCGPDGFGSYLMARDGSLLTRMGGQVLHLVHAPVPEAPPGHMPDMDQHRHDMPSHDGKGELTAAGKAGPLVYLASYRDKATAMRGWKELAAMAPVLKRAQPAFSKISLPGKGSFLRLKAKGLNEAEAHGLCQALIKTLPDCGARDRD